MGGLFGGGKTTPIPAPKKTRMPVETDPEIEDAAKRNREAVIQRRGRQSTIMSEATKETSGSPAASKLGG